MTLTEYCTGVANAIREVEGSAEAIPAPNHAERIRALSGGSDYIEVTLKASSRQYHYIDEAGEKRSLAPGVDTTAKVYRGVVAISSGAVMLATGDYVALNSTTCIFRSDGGTIDHD